MNFDYQYLRPQGSKPSNKLCIIFIFVGIAVTAIASVFMAIVSFENGPFNSVTQPPVSRELFPQVSHIS